MKRIVVVEDDLYLREEIIQSFEGRGYNALGISDFNAPVSRIFELSPDLVVLDLNLPVKNGFDICRELKSKYNFPILILTARDSLGDELCAIGLGADDYLTKPFHPDRLIARAERLLQSYEGMRGFLRAGPLIFDPETSKLVYRDESVILPEISGRILRMLFEHRPAPVGRTELIQKIWGDPEFSDPNILEVNIARLRKSLAAVGLKDAVVTVRGEGYLLEANEL